MTNPCGQPFSEKSGKKVGRNFLFCGRLNCAKMNIFLALKQGLVNKSNEP
jgi:hypothetical protein